MSSDIRNNNNYKHRDITVIPIDNTTMITTTSIKTKSLRGDVQQKREDTLCRFIREYIYKVAQVIVSARRVNPHSSTSTHNGGGYGGNNVLSESWNDLNATAYSQWFRIEMSDSHQIQKYIEDECIGNWDAKHSDFTLTIDISLSAEPLSEHVLLERWKIKFKREHFMATGSMNDPSLIYKRMTIQIRSILSYLRLLPTHSIVQSWEQSMAEQSMLMNINNRQNNNNIDNVYGGDDENILQHISPHSMTPFALYHLIYSHHNKQNDNINNFSGDSKSFCFEGLRTKFGTIRTTVFYGKNIRKDFEWLIRSVPGKNPPLVNDNLSQHIDSRSRYWDKKQEYKYDQDDHRNNDDVSDGSMNTQNSIKSNDSHRRSSSNRKDKNKLSKHYSKRNSPYRGPISVARKNSNGSPNFELIPRSPEQIGINPTALILDEQMVNIVSKQPSSSPPIKSLAVAANSNNNFHESPVLDYSSTPKLDPQKEMEKIRLSTIFGSAPPVISLADVSTVKDNRDIYCNRDSNHNQYGSGSQLLDSIVREKQIISTRKHSKITPMKTLMDEETVDNEQLNGITTIDTDDIFGDIERQLGESIDSSDMNCDESDHDDIQDEIFEGYDDDNSGQQNIAKISDFINMCSNANKLELKSFKIKDQLLTNVELMSNSQLKQNGDDNDDEMSHSKRYFKLLSKHFQIRQEKLIQLKKTSSTVLSHSVMRK